MTMDTAMARSSSRSRSTSCGARYFPNHLLDRQHLGEHMPERGARRPLQLGRRDFSNSGICGAVAQKEHAKIADGCLARSRFAANVGRDARDYDGVDPARAEDQLKIGAVKRTETRLVEKNVARVDDQPLVQRRRLRAFRD